MISNSAWKRHGCYRLGSEQYFNIPLENSLFGCHDDWNALDHFDPTTDSRLMFSQFNYLRTVYGSLQDGWALVQRGNWTNFIQRPGSNQTLTEVGLWSVSRGAIGGIQTVGGRYTDQVWLLYTNENTTKTYTYDCKDKLWMSSPFVSGTVVKNIFAPYEEYTLQESLSSFNNDSKAPYFGCLGSVTMDPFGFKLLVPVADWLAPPQMITKFTPGHDARILSNSTTVDITLEFNTAMVCDGVTNAIKLNMASSGKGGTPTIGNVRCDATKGQAGRLPGAPVSAWYWSATLSNFPDGVLEIVVTNAPSSGGGSTNVSDRSPLEVLTLICLQATDHFFLRKGTPDNVMIFPDNDYDTSGGFTFSNGQYQYTHKAYGADMFRYSGNFGRSWSDWKKWEDTTIMEKGVFDNSSNFWPGQHLQVQCESDFIRYKFKSFISVH